MYYKLVGEDHIPCDIKELEIKPIQVTNIPLSNGKEIKISTVFLGVDYGSPFTINDHPILYETMVFGGKYDQYQRRTYTYKLALSIHEHVVGLIENKIDENELDEILSSL